MLQFFDTSVLVAALSEAHPEHGEARQRLEKAHAGDHRLAVSTHALAETFSILTALPVTPRITPGQARHLVEEDVERVAQVVPLGSEDYMDTLERMARLGLVSGAIYDALNVRAAEIIEAEELLTFNGSDFRRMPPRGDTRLVVL